MKKKLEKLFFLNLSFQICYNNLTSKNAVLKKLQFMYYYAKLYFFRR